jgi:tRNA G18 (ribose-2'-O)-methylase SpoU
MPRFAIQYLDDPRLEVFRHLKSTNLTRWSGLFIAEGRRVVERLLASDFEVESLLVSDEREQQIAPLVSPETPLYVLPIAMARELVGYNFHTGVLACGRRPPARRLSDVVDNENKPLTLVVCPDVNDPDNLGSIIRSSSALGVDGLLLGNGCADPYSRRVSRLSMGHVYRLPFVESHDLHHDLLSLRDNWNVELAATVIEPGAEPLNSAARSSRFALLLGNEAHGLAPEWVQLCQRRITIPMRETGDSLNVSVSAAIFLYHFTRSANQEL